MTRDEFTANWAPENLHYWDQHLDALLTATREDMREQCAKHEPVRPEPTAEAILAEQRKHLLGEG